MNERLFKKMTVYKVNYSNDAKYTRYIFRESNQEIDQMTNMNTKGVEKIESINKINEKCIYRNEMIMNR